MGKKGKAQGGKKPKGRAAARGKAQKTSPRSGGGWQHSFVRQSDGLFGDSDDEPQQRGFRGFAQNTPRPGGFQQRNPNVKLRHQAIAFVSAGSNTPAEPEEQEETIAVAVEESGGNNDDEQGDIDETLQTHVTMDTDVEISEGAMASMNLQSSTENVGPDTDATQDVSANGTKDASPAPLFFVHTAGDPAVAVPTQQPVPRSPSPAPSDSSDEVVLFHGRNRPTVVDDPVTRPSKPATLQPRQQPPPPPRQESPHVTDGLLAALEQLPATKSRTPSPAKGWAARPSPFAAPQQESEPWQPASGVPYWKKGKGKSGRPRPDLNPTPSERMQLDSTPRNESKIKFAEPELGEDDDEEKDAEDTIAALQAEVRRSIREKKLEAKETESKANRRRKRGRKKDNRQMRNAIMSDEDDDEDAADEDYMENLKAQLEAGEDIPSFAAAAMKSGEGPSMVVNGKEYGADELLDKDEEGWESDSSDEGPIGQDLSELSDDEDLNLSDLESSDLADELEYQEHEQWEDEEDLRQRRIAAMDDETLARLWAKQIELGIEDDELVIDDGMFDDDELYDPGVGDLDAARLGLEDITNSAFGKRAASMGGPRRSRRGNNDLAFPSASALADSVEQYGENGFDIMDYERPSLKPKKKGRKGKLPEELEILSDDELREGLADQWANDRAKKRLKKAEREDMRMAGMLGPTGKKGKADLSQKYQFGMTMGQIHDELRVFLQDDGQNSRPFPPMDKRDRKALHELADKFNLKSKSVGSGHSRFPVLYKTSYTVEYSTAHFERMAAKSSRKFLANSSNKGKKMAKTPKRGPGRGGGFDKSAVSLRHGEVVGGDAAEIGRENFGHRLMEKMGWSRGQALGAQGEGMLTPVAQVMRTGKAGLG